MTPTEELITMCIPVVLITAAVVYYVLTSRKRRIK
jgi:hypothetical protein